MIYSIIYMYYCIVFPTFDTILSCKLVHLFRLFYPKFHISLRSVCDCVNIISKSFCMVLVQIWNDHAKFSIGVVWTHVLVPRIQWWNILPGDGDVLIIEKDLVVDHEDWDAGR